MDKAAESFSKTGDQYYYLNRDNRETKRLNKQHYLFTSSFRHLIHPAIPVDYKDSNLSISIADFATGTGIWALETAKTLPSTCQFHGFDISSKQFPPPETLPENVRFQEWDILMPLPEEYFGKYDIVNARALVLALGDVEWEVVIRNLVRVLKPGGYLQWGDPDLSPQGFKVIQSFPMAPRKYISLGLSLVQAWAKYLHRDLSSGNNLPAIFQKCGLKDVHHDFMSTDNDPGTRQELTSELCQAFADLIVKWATMMEGERSGKRLRLRDDIEEKHEIELTVGRAMEVRTGMLKEAESGGVYLRLDWNAVVGRKPTR